MIPFYACASEYRDLENEVLDLTARVLSTGQVLQGPQVETFESEIASACHRAYAVAVGSGTDALFFSLKAIGIQPGDEILVQDISFLASASAIFRAGARPVFIDIDEHFCLDLEKAKTKISARTRAIIVVQLFGGACDPHEVEQFAARYGLVVVEDFAQSFGASFNERPCGSVGSVAATSFDPTKVIGAPGSGGAVLTDDLSIAKRVRRLRLHGREERRFVEFGYNSQMPSWTAAMLSLKLAKSSAWQKRRREVADHYSDALTAAPIQIPTWRKSVGNVFHKFVIFTERRDDLAKYLHDKDIPTMIHYATPLHREPIFAGSQPDEEFPRANRHADRALSLPIHAYLNDTSISRIAEEIVRFFR